jgi:DNA (cytosine-5)-methyltransferase 1
MIRILELFGGIGAIRKAFERENIPHEVIDYVEIDKYAVASYNAMFNENFEVQDITTWNKDIDVDFIMHGSPCQDFSVAGKQAGGDLGSGTRSSLMYETIRIVGKLRPKYVMWENVKNILSKKHKHNFDAYIETMNILGYNSYYQVLNAKDYGIPQNRKRVYTISIRKDIDKGNFIFPEKQELKIRLKDVLEDNVEEKYYLSKEVASKYVQSKENNTNVIGNLVMDKWQDSMKRIYDIEKYSPAINTMQGGNLEPKIIINGRIRKLIPKECWRLMGFDDIDFEKAAKVNSNTQLYKQAGNSIVVNVLMAIFNELLKKEGE